MKFKNRREAGRVLAHRIRSLKLEETVVVGLPRGGVPVAWEVARALESPLEVAVVRKIGHPYQPEYGIGAITEEEFSSLEPALKKRYGDIHPRDLESALLHQIEEVRRQVHLFRGSRPMVPVSGKNVLIVDDGIATGITVIAAAEMMKRHGATTVTVAVPVCSTTMADLLLKNDCIDRLITVAKPSTVTAVGDWYEDFGQVTDAEVCKFLHRAREHGIVEHELILAHGGTKLPGILSIPPDCRGVVIFAHASSNSRLNARNRRLAHFVNRAGMAAFLFDLLTHEESLRQSNVFDLPLLAERLAIATGEVRSHEELANLPFGFLGTSTGAAAAMIAASELRNAAALVFRNGRPDLARECAAKVTAPVLLIVAENDSPTLEANESVLRLFPRANLVKIRGANHEFAEPGAMLAASHHAVDWFKRLFGRRERSIHAAA